MMPDDAQQQDTAAGENSAVPVAAASDMV